MVTEVWFAQDITQPIEVQHCKGVVFTNDNNGNKVGVRLFNGTAAYSPGGSVTCYVIRPDGVTVNFDGTVSSNVLSATLPATALTVPGQISVVLQSVNGSTLTTVFKGVFGCEQGTTGTIVAPSVNVSSLAELTAAVAGKVSKSGDTMTGRLNVANEVYIYNATAPGLQFWGNLGDSHYTGGVATNISQGRLYMWQWGPNATAREAYWLPAPDANTTAQTYQILTSKSPVTVAQGGTGMSAPASGTITWESGITEAEMSLYKFGRIAVLNGRITLASQVAAYGTLGTFPAGFVPAASVVNFLIETLDGSFYAAYSGSSGGSIRNRVTMPAQGYIINLVYVTSA